MQALRHVLLPVLERRQCAVVHALVHNMLAHHSPSIVIKVVGDVAQVTSPLVTKALINFGTQSYYSHRGVPGYTNPHVGLGVGLAFALWIMQIISSLSIHQFFVRSAGTGVLARGALIAAIYRRSLVLSGKSRTVITNGKLVNHISTDVSRIDFCAGFFHVRRVLVSPHPLKPILMVRVNRCHGQPRFS